MARGTAFLLLLAACGSTTIDVAHYHRACVNDSDCALVHAGDVCALCPCPDNAIASSDLARYEADTASMENGCPKNQPPVHCVPCVAMAPFCLGGTCSAHAQ
jgi:hypothetical protein